MSLFCELDHYMISLYKFGMVTKKGGWTCYIILRLSLMEQRSLTRRFFTIKATTGINYEYLSNVGMKKSQILILWSFIFRVCGSPNKRDFLTKKYSSICNT